MEIDATFLSKAVAALRSGHAVGMPTETVYGLAADARNADAIARVFALKGRPLDHPLIVHLPDMGMLDAWAIEVPSEAEALAAAFWPGPLSLVLRRHPSVLDAVTGGQPTIAVRVPSHPVALALLHAFGGALVAPSANRFGHVSPTSADHVRQEFGEALPIVLDGGACAVGIESSIVDLSGDTPRLLRPGMLAPDAIEAVLGRELLRGAAADSPRVSGALESHYSPRTQTVWVEIAQFRDTHFARDLHGQRVETGADQARIGVLALAHLPATLAGIALPADPEHYAQGLYAALRELDAGGFQRILVEAPPDTVGWLAIRDRLRRACA